MTFDLDAARAYVASVHWQFAKTMPDIPHEYTVRTWRPELEGAFIAMVELIHAEGRVKPWPRDAVSPRYHHTYLEIDGWQYWTMGEPAPETGLINRCRVGGATAA